MNESDIKQSKQKIEKILKKEMLEHLNILSMNNLELLDHIMNYIDFRFNELSCVGANVDMEKDDQFPEQDNIPFGTVSDILKDTRVKDGVVEKKLSTEEINQLYEEFCIEQNEKKEQTL